MATPLKNDSRSLPATTVSDLYAHLSKTQSLSQVGSWEVDLLQHRLWWSPEVYKLFELDPTISPASQSTFSKIIHPNDRERVNAAFLTSVEQRIPYDITHRLCMPDGRVKFVRERGVTTYDNDGTALQTVGTVQEVTAEIEASHKLANSERRLRSILNAVPHGIQENDLEGTITYSNEAHHHMLGIPSGELVGQKIWDFACSDDEGAELRSTLCHLIAELPEPSPYIIQNLRSDGQPVWLRIDWDYRFNSEDSLVGFTAIITDMTAQRAIERQLEIQEQEWRAAIDQADQAILILDNNNHLQRANRAFYRLAGIRGSAIGQSLQQLASAATQHRELILALANFEDNVTEVFEDSAQEYSFEIQTKALSDVGAIHYGRLITLSDLTYLRRLNQRLELFGAVFENTAEGIMVTDANKRIIEVNDAFTQITGYSSSDVARKQPTFLSSGRHEQSFYKNMWRSIKEHGRWSGEIWNRTKGGRVYPELLTINSIKNSDDEITHYVGIFSDISMLKSSEERIEHLSYYDALTDLPNRALLIERIEQAIRHANRTKSRCALVMLDLDRFKHINESYGHSVGDKLIRDIAENLRKIVRDDDTLARVGGDEFVLLFEDVDDVSRLGFVTERIQKVLALPVELPDQTVNMTASMGISVYPEDGSNASELLRNADAAMFHAKGQGRNTYHFYTEELTRKAFEVLLLENDLRQAIERNELQLFYQPQIDLNSGRIVGAEALVRWNHAVLGTVSPARFIPIAEESGLIIEIGDWVLEEGCRQLSLWHRSGINLKHLALNVAALQLTRGGMVSRLDVLLSLYGIRPDLIELEVTEGFVMDKSERSINQLNALRELGVSLAIDDFGTGYSSLSYLKDLPMDKLKIDQSFTRGVPDDPDDMAITKTILALGQGLNLRVIAEGVETLEQAEFLKAAGCQYAQGYLYSKPVPADEFEEYWERQNKL
ncbi:MAG TPA: EAL domain-containing protein [Marinobacterium sp.]|nr:EAL domain-containing protein [Marinobacterium sp.]